MLKVDSIADERPVSVKVDEYVPLHIEVQPPVVSIDEAFLWRSTNGNYLLEIELRAATGAVADVGLRLVPKERVARVRSIRDLLHLETGKRGLPLFQTAIWTAKIGKKEIGIDPAQRRYDESVPFKFFVAADGLAILFDSFSAHYKVSNGEVDFIFSSNDELCGVSVNDEKLGTAAVKYYG
jgi:hypothetical protein